MKKQNNVSYKEQRKNKTLEEWKEEEVEEDEVQMPNMQRSLFR